MSKNLLYLLRVGNNGEYFHGRAAFDTLEWICLVYLGKQPCPCSSALRCADRAIRVVFQDNEQGILITTSFAADRNRVEVKVRDDGAGIAPENLVRIKDPFFTTKRGTDGMGLGLPISATIIEDHHGSLNITSERGKGTTATISLPVIPR